METPEYCLFCDSKNLEKHRIAGENDFWYGRYDDFPVSPGHAEIIPKRHIHALFDLNSEELAALPEIFKFARRALDDKFHPDGYNYGVSEGTAAGQTMEHLHIHLIPRYVGDVGNPRGGVRHLIPGRGFYENPYEKNHEKDLLS